MDTEYSRNGSERFGIVPASILGKGLSRNALALYTVLAIHANRERECWPCQETLARVLGCDRRSVQRYLQELKSAGIVTCEYRNGTTLYTLLGRCDTGVVSEKEMRHWCRTRCDTGVVQNSNKEHSNSLEKLDNLDSSLERDYVMYDTGVAHSKHTGDTSVASSSNGNGHKKIDMTDFEGKLADFLEVYPPPEGGMPARKIVERAFHRVFYDGADLGDVVDGARRYTAFLREHPDRPVQDPVRWLERREWEREWTTPPAKKPKRSPVYDRATMLAAQKWQAGYRWRECVDEAREQLLKEGEHPPELIYAPFGNYGIMDEQEVAKNGHH